MGLVFVLVVLIMGFVWLFSLYPMYFLAKRFLPTLEHGVCFVIGIIGSGVYSALFIWLTFELRTMWPISISAVVMAIWSFVLLVNKLLGGGSQRKRSSSAQPL